MTECKMVGEGVLMLKPHGPLTSDDFLNAEKLLGRKKATGLVVSTDRFPGWENLIGFLSHVVFVLRHFQDFERVALSIGGILPKIMSRTLGKAIPAKVRIFGENELNSAIQWASGLPKDRAIEQPELQS